MHKKVIGKSLRIAIIVDAFPALSETFIVNQIIDLINRGHSVDIFSFSKGKAENAQPVVLQYNLLSNTSYFEFIEHTHTDRLIFFFSYFLKNFFSIKWGLLLACLNFFKHGKKSLNLSLFYECQWFLNKKPYDIIHAHFGHNGEFIARIKSYGLLRNAKLLTSFHGYDMLPSKTMFFKNQYQYVYNQSAFIIANTPYTKDLIEKIFTDTSKVVIHPVGLDTKLFSTSPEKSFKSNAKFNIFYCGRFVEVKAPQYAVEIINLVVNKYNFKNVLLVMVGTGPMLDEVQQKIIECNLSKYISLRGAQNQDSIIRIMEDSDTFLLPGVYEKESGIAETQGLVIQEAQAMGLPVIVSNVGGMKYGLIKNKTGYIVDEGDLETFAEKIVYLANNREVLERMSGEAVRFVRGKYDSAILGNKLEQLYFQTFDM